MNVFPLSGLGLSCNTNGKGIEYLVYPDIDNPRLMIPAKDFAVRESLFSFSPGNLKAWLKGIMLSFGIAKKKSIWISSTDLSSFNRELSKIFKANDLQIVFHTGTPGAYRKATLQIVSLNEGTLGYVKVADNDLSKITLQTEFENLTVLNRLNEIRSNIPNILYYGDWGNSTILALSSVPGKVGGAQLSCAHFNFLIRLHKATQENCVFASSPIWTTMNKKISENEPFFPETWNKLYRKGLNYLLKYIGNESVPISLAHGDFTPWNSRRVDGDLYVIDWESARTGMTPLYDAFHYSAIQRALSGERYKIPTSHMLKILNEVWPEGESYLPCLYLSYLIDISLFYGIARLRNPSQGDDRVWNWFGKRLEEFLGGK